MNLLDRPAAPRLSGDGVPHPLPAPGPSGAGLSRRECAGAVAIFGIWIGLFAGGILIDTAPYRNVIAVAGLGTLPPGSPGVLVSWIYVLLFFLPVNLALVCATAGMLGAFGNRANLHSDDMEREGRDNSNPYISALLRGFFAYLFLTSGLLLLDDAPFASPTADQYVRLAGFLSLLSFVVNYQPQVFSQLIVSAFQRIQTRGREEPARVAQEDAHYARATVEVASVQTVTEQTVTEQTVTTEALAAPPVAALPAAPPPQATAAEERGAEIGGR